MVENLKFYTKNGNLLKYQEIDKIWGLRNYPVKLIWNYQGEQIIIEDNNQSFFFELNLDKVIVLFNGRWSNNYKHPNNLCIYNADGTLYKTVKSPKFKSMEMIEGINGKSVYGFMDNMIVWEVPPHKREIKNIFGNVKKIEIEQGFMDTLKRCGDEIAVSISDSTFFENQILNVIEGEFKDEAKFMGKY